MIRFMSATLAVLCFAQLPSFAQKNSEPKKNNAAKEAVITYASKSNGREMQGNPVRIFIKNDKVAFSQTGGRERQYLDYSQKSSLQLLTLDDGTYLLKKPFSANPEVTLLPETDTILGYPVKKAKFVLRSNTIEVWYTTALAIKGAPGISSAPQLGLVLKAVRNGNSETYAKEITFRPVTEQELSWPGKAEVVDEPTYQANIIRSRYRTINIFTQEQLSFGNPINNPQGDKLNETYHYSGGTIVLKKVQLPKMRRGQNLFIELTQYSNGDAYDRTGSVFVIPTDKKESFLTGLRDGAKALPSFTASNGKTYQGVVATDTYQPPLEIMRFFTPFGVRHYNKQVQIKGYPWADSVIYKQDITELSPSLEGEVWIGVFIGNYDKGGHKVSLDFKYYPGFDGDRPEAQHTAWINPIFNTTNVMEMTGQEYGTIFEKDSLTVTVDIPEGVSNLKMRYITTGHGGWGGGDEFNPKLNEIFVDEQRVYHFIPWRTDCAVYRLSNPASGNFGTGLSSSDLSRSNWCPGTLTLPVDVPLPDLKPGKHTFKVAIPLGKPEGGSFSAWNVSGTLIGDKK
ncbi:peptide-N-glycosidase F-related protein [Chitinophaga horti]|uniref:Peptide-N-glycosidase F-related protein n=1 Tax=Chitinophaga horti TaxID=2920382 RepID=A0ABY6J3Z2_9BACT|nr:PNGase F N-terminal domain-containing protein [Chitinophaga horti]UYQ92904.1 peptide-N-glycosidase F-related protein [Chitinophaga horti]